MPIESSIKFGVESSVSITGVFDKWNATINFSSRNIRSAVLDIEIEAGSVNTGSHIKDNKLKGKDLFDVKECPLITFKSTKIVQTGPYRRCGMRLGWIYEWRSTDEQTHKHLAS